MVFPHTYRTENSITKTTSSSYGEFYELNKIVHEPITPEVMTLLNYVDDNTLEFMEDLAEFVSIKSISCEYSHRNHVSTMITVVENWMKTLGVKYECFDVGWYEAKNICCKIPVVILGRLGNDPKKKTVLVYSHLDVNGCVKNWETDPWKLTEKTQRLHGKGVAFGKGPLICWLHAIYSYQKHKIELPVNIQFVIESSYHLDSTGLEGLIKAKKKEFSQVDYIVVSGLDWLGPKTPCLIYGCSGICRFSVRATKNGNSDPKSDLEKLRDKIIDENGKTQVPFINKNMESITPSEEKLYDLIDFNVEEILPTLPPCKRNWDKVQYLMSFWRIPKIVTSNILNCSCDKKDENIFELDFSVTVVPNQRPEVVGKDIVHYVCETCKVINCRSKIECSLVNAIRPWIVSFKSPSYEAARKACVQIYSVEPNMIRDDKSNHILLLFEKLLQKNMIFLPLFPHDTKLGLPNESIPKKSFFSSIKFLIAFMKQLSVVNKK